MRPIAASSLVDLRGMAVAVGILRE